MAQKSDMRSMGAIMSQANKEKLIVVDRVLRKFVKRANAYCTTTFTRKGDGSLEQKQEWSQS